MSLSECERERESAGWLKKWSVLLTSFSCSFHYTSTPPPSSKSSSYPAGDAAVTVDDVAVAADINWPRLELYGWMS